MLGEKDYFGITSCAPNLVTALKRKATEIISELDHDREPVLITQHGRSAAYLLDVESYEALQQKLVLLEGIARGERAVGDGRVVSHTEAEQRLRRWLN